MRDGALYFVAMAFANLANIATHYLAAHDPRLALDTRDLRFCLHDVPPHAQSPRNGALRHPFAVVRQQLKYHAEHLRPGGLSCPHAIDIAPFRPGVTCTHRIRALVDNTRPWH